MAHCTPLATLSFDDGGWQDAEVMNVLRALRVPATYYLPSCVLMESVYNGMHKDEIRDLYLQSDVEIGAHTVSHVRLDHHLPSADREREVRDGLDQLMRFFCVRVPAVDIRCFAYPYGDHSPAAMVAVERAGFILGRTCKRDSPSAVRRGHRSFNLPITAILRPQNHDWAGVLKSAVAEKLDIHLVSHAWELVKFGALGLLESVVREMLEKGYQFKTNSEFAQS